MTQHTKKPSESESRAIQTKPSQGATGSNATLKNTDNRPEAALQRKIQNMADNSPLVEKHARQQAHIQKKENNTGLPDDLKSGIESLSGVAMDDVKVHRNSDKPAQLNALAYAQGTHIHLGPGQEGHLPHEAWHVAQQKQGRVSATHTEGNASINSDPSLENEADVMGAKASRSQAIPAGKTPSYSASSGSTASGPVQRKLSLTYAQTPPGARQEYKMGLGETATLSSDRKTSNPEYNIDSGGGTLAGATYTATAAGVVKLSARNQGEPDRSSDKTTVYVVAPRDANMLFLSSQADFFDGRNTAGAGFFGGVELLPNNVSFSALQWREGGGTMTADGAYISENNRAHTNGPDIDVGTDNKIIGQDDVRSMGVERANVVESKSDWPIEWQYQLPGEVAYTTFTIATHSNRMDNNGYTTASKKGVQVGRRARWA